MLVAESIAAQMQDPINGVPFGSESWCQVAAAWIDTSKDAVRAAARTGKYRIVHSHPKDKGACGERCVVVMPDYKWAGSNPPGTYPEGGGDVAAITERLS